MAGRVLVDVEEHFFPPYHALRFLRTIGAQFHRGERLREDHPTDQVVEADYKVGQGAREVVLSYEYTQKSARLVATGHAGHVEALALQLRSGGYAS